MLTTHAYWIYRHPPVVPTVPKYEFRIIGSLLPAQLSDMTTLSWTVRGRSELWCIWPTGLAAQPRTGDTSPLATLAETFHLEALALSGSTAPRVRDDLILLKLRAEQQPDLHSTLRRDKTQPCINTEGSAPKTKKKTSSTLLLSSQRHINPRNHERQSSIVDGSRPHALERPL